MGLAVQIAVSGFSHAVACAQASASIYTTLVLKLSLDTKKAVQAVFEESIQVFPVCTCRCSHTFMSAGQSQLRRYSLCGYSKVQ